MKGMPSRSRDGEHSCSGSAVPEWVRGMEIWKTLDAKQLAEGGGDIKRAVLEDLAALPDGVIYLVVSPEPFGDLPAAAREHGLRVFSDEPMPGLFKLYISRG